MPLPLAEFSPFAMTTSIFLSFLMLCSFSLRKPQPFIPTMSPIASMFISFSLSKQNIGGSGGAGGWILRAVAFARLISEGATGYAGGDRAAQPRGKTQRRKSCGAVKPPAPLRFSGKFPPQAEICGSPPAPVLPHYLTENNMRQPQGACVCPHKNIPYTHREPISSFTSHEGLPKREPLGVFYKISSGKLILNSLASKNYHTSGSH